MTYEVRTPTIALDEHEIRSLRRWLNQMVTVNGRDIFLQRAPADFTRPAYVLKEIDRNPVDRGRSLTMDETDWQIEILTEDFWDTKRQVAEIRQRLLQVGRVPLYLWGWQYPDITIEELPGLGSLPAGQVSVGVSAVNHEDEESLLSNTVQLTVALDSAIRVSWTPWPRAVPVAKEYRVYAGVLDAETLETTVADPGSRLSVFHDITSLVGGGASPPTSSVFFANRYLRVPHNQVQSRMMEHPAADGVFNGIVSFRTLVESVRIAQPGIAPVREIGTVTKTVEVV
jgi:hypothetical protein